MERSWGQEGGTWGLRLEAEEGGWQLRVWCSDQGLGTGIHGTGTIASGRLSGSPETFWGFSQRKGRLS